MGGAAPDQPCFLDFSEQVLRYGSHSRCIQLGMAVFPPVLIRFRRAQFREQAIQWPHRYAPGAPRHYLPCSIQRAQHRLRLSVSRQPGVMSNPRAPRGPHLVLVYFQGLEPLSPKPPAEAHEPAHSTADAPPPVAGAYSGRLPQVLTLEQSSDKLAARTVPRDRFEQTLRDKSPIFRAPAASYPCIPTIASNLRASALAHILRR